MGLIGRAKSSVFTCEGRRFCPSCHPYRVRHTAPWIATSVCQPPALGISKLDSRAPSGLARGVKRRLLIGVLGVSHLLVAWAGYAWASRQTAGAVAPVVTAVSPPPQDGKPGRLKEFGPETDFAAQMAARYASRSSTTPETKACLAAWLEHDGVAALRWLAVTPNNSNYRDVILAHLARHGDAELVRLLNAAPEARGPLLFCYREWMKTRQPADLLAVAAEVKDSPARIDLLRWSLRDDPATLIRHLPEIRKLLDERAAVEFFWFTDRSMPLEQIADAAKQAGFPDEAVANVRQAAKAAAEANRSIGDLLAKPNMDDQRWREELFSKLSGQHPELSGWCADFAERGLSADTIVERLQQAEPALSAHPEETRRLVFAAILATDPENATRWLQATCPEWEAVFSKTIEAQSGKLRVEQRCQLATLLDGSGAMKALEGQIQIGFFNWFSRDPRNCLAGIETLTSGTRHDDLLDRCLADSRVKDEALRAEMLQKIQDPACRAAAAERLRKYP